MDESSNNPVDDRSGIGETITTALRQPSILRVMVGLAATVVVFVGMRLAAPILNPILFAVVLALLFSPIYAWLRRHRIPTPLALVFMLVGLTLLFVGIFLIMGVSIARFSGDIASYTGKLNVQVDNLQDLAKSAGALGCGYPRRGETKCPCRSHRQRAGRRRRLPEQPVPDPVIVLFLLAEGPAMMNRLRASAGSDHPR